jgi:hypothetical protein
MLRIHRHWAQICFCERLALILTFSPWEKEKMSLDFGFADARPASPAAGFSKGQPTILPLPRQWERAGVRVARKKKFAKNRFAPIASTATCLALTFDDKSAACFSYELPTLCFAFPVCDWNGDAGG